MAKKKKKSEANTTYVTTVDAMPPADYPMISEDEPLPPPDDSEPSAPEDAPVLSPYTSPSCRVYFRNKIPFFVPRDLLCNASELLGALATLRSDEPQDEPQDELNDIHIDEVPDDAGHVLVHYLYTGTWQTLSQSHSQQEPLTCYDSNISVIKSDFETSVHVYCAAKAYGLPALVEMAKKEVLRLANCLTPLDVVVSASEACQLLSEHDIWFRSFLQRRLRLMFNTSKYLDESVFLGCVQHGTVYSNFLVKSMFLLCCQNSRNRRVLSVADEEQSVFETDEAHLNGSETAADVPAEDHLSFGSQAEPLAEETKVPETPPSDDWAVAEQTTIEEFAEPTEPLAEWVETKESDPADYISDPVDCIPEAPPEDCPQDESHLVQPTTKSKKDKKKPKKTKSLKKNEGVLINNGVELVSEWGTRLAEENERDELASSILQPNPVEEPGVQPVLEDEAGSEQDLWGILSKKQKKKKSEKAIVSEQEKEPEPEAVPEVEAGPWPLWGELPKSKKKKKEKKVEGDKKKKNKNQEIVSDAPSPESGTEPGAETSTMRMENPWGFPKKKKTLTREQMIMPDLGCPDRVTHILGDGWTGCSTCREQVGNISGEYQANQANKGERLLS
ncbi:hypothetical protein GCG54_00006344 [Colletotrichum gloeosporioides]|uniref:BTB domain-containing protein n=1 Tax=Colletotrichum gloeosporioides TaxID=474922 RepID=A0A8H4CRH2_COLGL|nr:uncharacterized protein GCG54_00006344 [Colletotrichum gloeosporioides]KAF3808482.1 hypothetical protein GCG54_00006344 [Colletotrichum gloeosporioides]